MNHISLFAHDNHRGLSEDIHVVSDTLGRAGYTVELFDLRYAGHRDDGSRIWKPDSLPSSTAMTIALEYPVEAAFDVSDVNLLIPNPETLSARKVALLTKYTAILAKTKYTDKLVRQHGANSIHTGFTSRDARLAHVSASGAAFLHAAGTAHNKSTKLLCDTWVRHQSWPKLTIIADREAASSLPNAPNVTILSNLARETVQSLQNSHPFHIYPTQAAGWGHAVVEGLSCGAIVVTTAAPPMDELVNTSTGFLVAAVERPEKEGLSSSFAFQEDDLVRCIDACLSMNESSRSAMSKAARMWFIENDRTFRRTLPRTIEHLLRSTHRTS